MSFVPNIGDEFVLIQCLGDVTGKPKAFFSGIDPDAATLEIRNNSVIVVITGCQKPPLNVSNCTECQPGYLLHENNVTCSPCSQGFISSTNNSRSCDVCPRDSIQPEPGQTSCQPCPNGTTTNDHITCLPINTASIVDLSSSSKSPKVVTWVIPVIFFGILLLFILFTRKRKEKKEIVVTLEQEPDELDQHDEPLLLIPPVFPDFPVCPSLLFSHCLSSFFSRLHCFDDDRMKVKQSQQPQQQQKRKRRLFAFYSSIHLFFTIDFTQTG